MISLDRKRMWYLFASVLGISILVFYFTVDVQLETDYLDNISSTIRSDDEGEHLIIGLHNNGNRKINRITLLVKSSDYDGNPINEGEELSFLVDLGPYQSAEAEINYRSYTIVEFCWTSTVSAAYGPLF